MAEHATDAVAATDAELVRDAREGGAAAFEALTARHFPMVYALAYARLGAREAAEDLAQEVFLLAFLHLGALADPARFAAWLGRIARNEAGMWRRRSQSASRLVRLVPLDDLPAEPAAPASQEARTALEADEETRALHEALFRLPEALREVVLLHYFEDLSKAEIAARLEVHPATVGRQIEKALKAMKRTLEPILRRAAPAFRHSGKAAARTTLLVGAVAAVSAPAKAALLAEAGVTATTFAALAHVAVTWHTILSGGFLMSVKTQVTAILVLLVLIAGSAYFRMSQTKAATIAPSVVTASPLSTPTAKEPVVTNSSTSPTTGTVGAPGLQKADLIRIVRAARSKIDNIDCNFDIAYDYTTPIVDASDGRLVYMSVRFAQQGAKRRGTNRSSGIPALGADGKPKFTYEDEFGFDGEQSWSHRLDARMGTIRKGVDPRTNSPMVTAYLDCVGLTNIPESDRREVNLLEYLAKESVSLRREMENVNDIPCYVLEDGNPRRPMSRHWVAPSLGYVIVRVEIYNGLSEDGNPKKYFAAVCKDFQEYDAGVYLPMRVDISQYDGKGSLIYTAALTIPERGAIRINQALGDDFFSPNFPPNVPVADLDSGTTSYPGGRTTRQRSR